MAKLQVVEFSNPHYEIIECDGDIDKFFAAREEIATSVMESINGKMPSDGFEPLVFFAHKSESGKLRQKAVAEDGDGVFTALKSILDRIPGPIRVIACFRKVRMDDTYERFLEDTDNTLVLQTEPIMVATFETQGGKKVLFRRFEVQNDDDSEEAEEEEESSGSIEMSGDNT